VLIPTVAQLHERDPESIPVIYRESYRLLFFLAVPAFASLAVASPLISRLWIGHYEPAFIEFVAILSIAWLVNVLANPAYVVFLGVGALRWVSAACMVTLILNAALGYLVGHYAPASFRALAIVATSALSLAVGYLIVVAAFHHQNRVPFSQLLPEGSNRLLACSFASAFVLFPALCEASLRSSPPLIFAAAVVALLVAIVLVPVWLHPMRKRILRWVFSRVPA